MAPLLLLFIFMLLPAIIPVRSAKQTALSKSAGGSISISCSYGQQYKGRVQWCKRKDKTSCSPVTRSDRVSITDEPHKFILTMRNLQESDEGIYWCAVDDGWTKKATSDEEYKLSITAAQSVRTDSWVSAYRGEPATISCYYDQNYKDKTKYLCRGYERDSCSRIAQSDGEQSRGTVSVSDDRDQMVFNVTIRDLQQEDFGYYWCAVEASAAQNDRAFVPLIVREITPVTTTQQTEGNHHTTVRTTVSSPFPLAFNSTRQNTTDGKTYIHDIWGRALHITLHTAVGLVYLICTIVAVMRTWSYCSKQLNHGLLSQTRAKRTVRPEDVIMQVCISEEEEVTRARTSLFMHSVVLMVTVSLFYLFKMLLSLWDGASQHIRQ